MEIIRLPLPQDYFGICIREFLQANECEQLIPSGFQATISHYPNYYRNNDRRVCDAPDQANQLFGSLPGEALDLLGSQGNLSGLNPRLRFCRYQTGQYFSRHRDGVHYSNDGTESRLSFVLYLNDGDDFRGGRTLFFEDQHHPDPHYAFEPQAGDLLIFDHRVWHSGEILHQGTKYVLRSDLMFRKTVAHPRLDYRLTGPNGHQGYIWKLLNYEERFLLSAGRDRSIRVWDRLGHCRQVLQGHSSSIVSMCRLENGHLASAGREGQIRIWSLHSERFQLKTSLKGHRSVVLQLIPWRENFLSSGGDGWIKCWNSGGELVWKRKMHGGWVWGLQVINDCLGMSADEQGDVRLWSLETGDPVQDWNMDYGVLGMGWQPGTQHLLLGNAQGELHLLRLEGHRLIPVRSLSGAHRGIVRCITPLNDAWLTCAEDGQVIQWSTDLRQMQQRLQHQDFAQSAARFGGAIYSAGYDGQILRVAEQIAVPCLTY